MPIGKQTYQPHIIAVVWGSFVTLVGYIFLCMFMPSFLVSDCLARV